MAKEATLTGQFASVWPTWWTTVSLQYNEDLKSTSMWPIQ